MKDFLILAVPAYNLGCRMENSINKNIKNIYSFKYQLPGCIEKSRKAKHLQYYCFGIDLKKKKLKKALVVTPDHLNFSPISRTHFFRYDKKNMCF